MELQRLKGNAGHKKKERISIKGSAGAKVSYSKKNPDGSVRTIKNVYPGSPQEQQLEQQGFVRGTQTVGVKPSVEEREEERLRASVDTLSERADSDPNKFYEEESFKQNEDGSLYIDPVSNAPVRLKPFYEATGRRRGTLRQSCVWGNSGTMPRS